MGPRHGDRVNRNRGDGVYHRSERRLKRHPGGFHPQAINAARKTLRDADVALAGAKARVQAYQDRNAREPGSVTKEAEDAARDVRSAEIARAAAAASLEEILRFAAVGR